MSSVCTLITLILSTLQLAQSSTIEATSVINNTEIYNISSSNAYDDIICTKSNCQVICSTNAACFKLNIYAEDSDIFVLQCIDDISCEDTKLINGAKEVNDIFCVGKSSCYNANFDLSNVSDVNIICNYSITNPNGVYSEDTRSPCHSAIIIAEHSDNIEIYCGIWGCYNTQFFVNDSYNVQFDFNGYAAGKYALISDDYIENELIVNCHTEYSCWSLDEIFCPNTSTCSINCKVADSCGLTTIVLVNSMYEHLNLNYVSTEGIDYLYFTCQDTNMKTSLELNSVNNRIQCEDFECCPNQFASDVFICNENTCNDICTETSSCANKIVDGSMVSSLMVTCMDDASCRGIKIKCPTNEGSSCTFICHDGSDCNYVTIKADEANHVKEYYFSLGGNQGFGIALLLLDFIEIDTWNLYLTDDITIKYGDQMSTIGTFNITRGGGYLSKVDFLFAEMNIVVSDLIVYCKGCYERIFHFVVDNSVKMVCEPSGLGCTDGEFQFDLLDDTATAEIICNYCGDAKFTVKSSKLVNENIASFTCVTPIDNEIGRCYDTQVNLILADKAIVNCEGYSGCASTYIFGSRAGMLEVNCYDEKSCVNAVVTCPSHSENVCKITCDKYEDVCRGVTIYPNWNDYVYGYLDLTCYPDEEGCEGDGYWTYKCQDYCSDVNFNCYIDKKNTHLVYDYDDNQFKCNHTSSSYCCPWNVSDFIPNQSTILNITEDTADGVSYIYDQIHFVAAYIILKAIFL